MKDFFLLILLGGLALTYGFLRSHPDVVSEAALTYLWFAVVSVGATVLVRITSFLLLDLFLIRSRGRRPTHLARLLIEIFLYGFAACVIARFVFHLDLMAIITASALLTAIIGFALQATLGHLFAGIALRLEQQFRVGDDIKVGDHVGLVESLTWRSVSVRTFYGSTLIIPNSKIADEVVEILPADRDSANTITISVPISAAPQRVIEIIHEVVLSVPRVNHSRPPVVQALEERVNYQWIMLYRVIYYPEDNRATVFTDAEIKKRVWYALRRHAIGEQAAQEHTAERTARFQAAMSTVPLFADVSESDREFLAAHAKPLVYAPGEPIQLRQPAKGSLFLISRGAVQAQVTKLSERVAQDGHVDTAVGEGASLALWPAQELERISTELALYIGPLAPFLVKQAAATTSDPYWLYYWVAEDISTPADRQAFLRQAPRFPVVRFRRGDLLGDLSDLTGVAIDMPRIEATGEVELLALSPLVIEQLFSRSPELRAHLTSKLTAYQEQLHGVFGLSR